MDNMRNLHHQVDSFVKSGMSRMKEKRHSLKSAFFAIFAACMLLAQTAVTIMNVNVWPVSSFNVFSHRTEVHFSRIFVLVRDSQGRTEMVSAAKLLPVEFFKADAIMRRIYLQHGNSWAKAEFARRTLDRLNHRKWAAFDEIAGPPLLHDLESMQVLVVRLNATRRHPTFGFHPISAHVLFDSAAEPQ